MLPSLADGTTDVRSTALFCRPFPVTRRRGLHLLNDAGDVDRRDVHVFHDARSIRGDASSRGLDVAVDLRPGLEVDRILAIQLVDVDLDRDDLLQRVETL